MPKDLPKPVRLITKKKAKDDKGPSGAPSEISRRIQPSGRVQATRRDPSLGQKDRRGGRPPSRQA